MKHLLSITLLCFVALFSSARDIDVRLFSTNRLTESWVSVASGQYAIIALNSKNEILDTVAQMQPEPKDIFHVQINANGVNVILDEQNFGGFSGLMLAPITEHTSFIIKGKGRERIYSGSLIFSKTGNELLLINRVELEDYVAGVVESEGGHVDSYAYFKAQAVLARTWVLRNIDKHKKEGYNVRDDVTSQAYYSMAYLQNSKAILQAVYETRDTVLIDNTGNIVFGAFHANSGGETVNAEDVWQQSIPYLRGVTDTFSSKMEKAYWQKEIDKEQFISFFATKMGFSTSDAEFRRAVVSIKQTKRMAYFSYEGKKLKMRWVREHFRLRSTFFTVADHGTTVKLNGKGFGHGVGLSQEGAMRMAELGFSYKQILSHYFTGVKYSTATALLP